MEAIKLVRHLRGMRVATILGGMPFGKQVAELANARVVVATPGRLLDLHNQGKISLASVSSLVVDEADRMLDLGFSEDLEAIQSLCAGREQTLMFSATFAPRIMSLASAMMKAPGRIELANATERHENISQALYYADNYTHKMKLLDHWLATPDMDQAIIFARTQVETEELADRLVGEGHSATALHGAMPQAVRNRRLQGLRQGQVRVLVATDVAARGIDVPTISHVINFGLPMKPEDYVHRIGRTGRAGRNGMAVTFAEASERGKVRAIERFIDNAIPEEIVAGLEPTRRASAGAGARKGAGGAGGAGRKGFASKPFAAKPFAAKPRFAEGATAPAVGKPFVRQAEAGGESSEKRAFERKSRAQDAASFAPKPRFERTEGGFKGRDDGHKAGGEGFKARAEGAKVYGDAAKGKREGFGAKREGSANKAEGYAAKREGFAGKTAYAARGDGFAARKPQSEARTTRTFASDTATASDARVDTRSTTLHVKGAGRSFAKAGAAKGGFDARRGGASRGDGGARAGRRGF
jgi:superfamily II DNA/RNA helicase